MNKKYLKNNIFNAIFRKALVSKDKFMSRARNLVNNMTRRSPAGLTSVITPAPILQLPPNTNEDSLIDDYLQRRKRLADGRQQSSFTRGMSRGRGRY